MIDAIFFNLTIINASFNNLSSITKFVAIFTTSYYLHSGPYNKMCQWSRMPINVLWLFVELCEISGKIPVFD